MGNVSVLTQHAPTDTGLHTLHCKFGQAAALAACCGRFVRGRPALLLLLHAVRVVLSQMRRASSLRLALCLARLSLRGEEMAPKLALCLLGMQPATYQDAIAVGAAVKACAGLVCTLFRNLCLM